MPHRDLTGRLEDVALGEGERALKAIEPLPNPA